MCPNLISVNDPPRLINASQRPLVDNTAALVPPRESTRVFYDNFFLRPICTAFESGVSRIRIR